MQTLSQGKTYDYVIHGTFIAIFGIIMILIHPLFAIFVVIGISLALLSSGIQIDAKNKKIRKYFAAEVIYFGKWIDLNTIQKILLRYNGHPGNTYRPIYLNKAPSSLRTYDLILTNKDDQSTVLFEFLSRELSNEAMQKLSEITDCEIDNQVQAHLLEQRRKLR